MEKHVSIIRRCEQSFLRSRLETYGLTPLDGLTLRLLSCLPECNQEEMCLTLSVDKGRIAKTMAHLEEHGLICRSTNAQDKREKLIQLTPTGQTVAVRIEKVFEEWNLVCLQGFTEEERTKYFSFIERIAENAAANRREERQHGQKSN